MSMAHIHATAADIRAVGGLEAFTRKIVGQAMLGAGRILAVHEGGKKGGKRAKATLPVEPVTEPTEDEEQAVVIAWAKALEGRYPALALLHHIPNGGLRNAVVAKKFAGQGVKSGVPDLCLPVPCHGYHGLYVEMKRRTKGAISPSQQAWLDSLQAGGYRAVVCRGADAAKAEIANYLGVRV